MVGYSPLLQVTGEPEAEEKEGAIGCCSLELKHWEDKTWKDILTCFILNMLNK